MHITDGNSQDLKSKRNSCIATEMSQDRGQMASSRCTAHSETVWIKIKLHCFLGTNLVLCISLIALGYWEL